MHSSLGGLDGSHLSVSTLGALSKAACTAVQVAHERSSVELQAVCTEVAGDCLPNVVVSFTTLLTCITQKHPYLCCNKALRFLRSLKGQLLTHGSCCLVMLALRKHVQAVVAVQRGKLALFAGDLFLQGAYTSPS